MDNLFPFTKKRIKIVVAKGAVTHKQDEWQTLDVASHMLHAQTHIASFIEAEMGSLHDPNASEDHLGSAIVRLMMVSELRLQALKDFQYRKES